MQKINYYVASSIDGYICGPQDDISGFVSSGSGLKKYLEDLQEFDTVIMGRRTYEFGYNFGLKPGEPAYPHMQHYIFSSHLTFDSPHPKVRVVPIGLKELRTIRESAGTTIYLCGGGKFAGWLLDNQQIDLLTVKLNPFIQGAGIRLFGNSTQQFKLELISNNSYEKSLQILKYKIIYYR